jgi:hypothetical protein
MPPPVLDVPAFQRLLRAGTALRRRTRCASALCSAGLARPAISLLSAHGIDAETRRFPVFTVLFTAICVVVFAARRVLGDGAAVDVRHYVYYPGWSGPLTALAAGFLHFGYFHILSNLIYLVLFGRYLEDRLGPAVFALLFLGSTLVGNLAQGWYNLHVLHRRDTTPRVRCWAPRRVPGPVGTTTSKWPTGLCAAVATNGVGTAQIHV